MDGSTDLVPFAEDHALVASGLGSARSVCTLLLGVWYRRGQGGGRMEVEEKAGTRVLPRYARLLGASQGRAQREASEAARACLVAMRFRFPEALYLVELVIRLGEVGAFDLAGSVKQIADMIGELLGEPPPDAVKLQRAMRALDKRTCLVKKQSRQRWRLCLAGISDPASPQHRLLLAETPSPYRLGAAAEAQPQRHDADARAEREVLRQRLEETASKLREAEAERDAARAAQADLERQLQAVRADLAHLGGEVDALRGERAETELARRADRAAVEVERDHLAQRAHEQEVALDALRDQLNARDRELEAEREHRRLADEARASDIGALEEIVKAQAAAAAERQQLEEAVLDRDVSLEHAERQLAELRADFERVEAAANARVQAAESAATEEAARSAGLKAILKCVFRPS